MKRDVQNYIVSMQKQYNELNKILDHINTQISNGDVTDEQRDNFMTYYTSVKSNYDRVMYIYHLLCLPPKFIQVIRSKVFNILNNHYSKNYDDDFPEGSTLEDVIKENDNMIEKMADESSYKDDSVVDE